jgi:hypothetical protein
MPLQQGQFIKLVIKWKFICFFSFSLILFQHIEVMENMLKDFRVGEHLLLVGNQVLIETILIFHLFII